MMFAYTIVHLLIRKKTNQSKKAAKFGLRLSEQFAEVRQVGGSKFVTKFTFLEVEALRMPYVEVKDPHINIWRMPHKSYPHPDPGIGGMRGMNS